jgi:hypothetical protein
LWSCNEGERQILIKKTGEVRDEVVAGVTSLAPERADAGWLLALVHGHWPIANQSHGVREVTCDEDRLHVRCGYMPQVMAAVRHTVIGLMRWAGQTNSAAACRRLAAQPESAVKLIGMTLENCMACPWLQPLTSDRFLATLPTVRLSCT